MATPRAMAVLITVAHVAVTVVVALLRSDGFEN
jgi:hypothetical protein